MWKPQNISLLLVGLVLLSACSSSKFSTRKEEQRTVAIISDPKNDLLASASMGRPVKIRGGAGATALLGGAITLGVNGVKKMIEANRKKYNVEYHASQRELYFYHDIT